MIYLIAPSRRVYSGTELEIIPQLERLGFHGITARVRDLRARTGHTPSIHLTVEGDDMQLSYGTLDMDDAMPWPLDDLRREIDELGGA